MHLRFGKAKRQADHKSDKMKCDGCNKTMHGVRYRCLECDGVFYCKRCQQGGIHSHHTIVEANDTILSRNLPLISAVAATKTTAAFIGPAAIHATSQPCGAEVNLHRQPPRSRKIQNPVDASKTSKDPQSQSVTSLPYGIERGPSTPSLPYGIVPVAPPIVQSSTNLSFVDAQPKAAVGSLPPKSLTGNAHQSQPPSVEASNRKPLTMRNFVQNATSADVPLQSVDDRDSHETENRRSAIVAVKEPEFFRSRDFQPYGIAPVAPPVAPVPVTSVASRPQEVAPELDVYTQRWVPANPTFAFKRVELLETDPEFKAVIQNVERMGGKKFKSKVQMICRIENYRLYKTYNCCREDMTRVNDPGTVNERNLWHGTSADVLDNIYRDGFNRSYCGKNATAYGNGVYFAASFEYSASPTYSPPDSKGQKYVFQCRVLTGQFTQGKQGLKEPPMRTPEFRFDSVVDSMSAPTMFIVFKDMQVYPEYVITLKL